MGARPPTRVQAVAGGVLACLAALSCGGSGPSTPITPVTTTTTTTTPPAGGGGASASCSLGAGSLQTTCAVESAALADYVETAINMLVQERPQLFDLKDTARPDSDLYRVLDSEGYLEGVVTNIRRQGGCAERDLDDPDRRRIQLKRSTESSETYDLLSGGYVRRTWSGYVDTCHPAAFPVDRASADVPPPGSGCGRPYPPKVTRFNCKVHIPGQEFYTVDSTPLVGHDLAYCASIGFVGRSLCPVRPEGAPDRVACENWRVGRARDTGRSGPTWTNAETGAYCTGPESNCSNHADTQFLVHVYHSGLLRAEAENGASCLLQVDR